MKASEFATSSTQRAIEAQALLQEELTDAVNSGLVRKADKSQSVLRENAYSTGRRRAMRGVSEAALSALADNRKKKGSQEELLEEEASEAQASQHLKNISGSPIKALLKGAGKVISVGKALENTELEGADSLYFKGKKVMHVTHAVGREAAHATGSAGRRLKNGIKSSGRKSGKHSEMNHINKSRMAEMKRKEQAAVHFKRNVYSTAKKSKAASAAAQKGTTLAKGGARALLRFLVPAAVPLVSVVLGVLFLLVLLPSILGGGAAGAEDKAAVTGYGTLTGVQLEVAQALAAEGLGPAQIAAIMGNISGESGWNPNAEYHGEGNGYAYEYGYGLYQFTDTSGGGNEYTRFANWCRANGKSRSSAAAQTQFFIENLRYSWATALHRSGYYTKYITEYAGKDASYDAWLATTDVGFSTYCFMACWLRPADWAARNSFYSSRLPEAEAFYAQLASSGSGQEYAASGETQRAIVNAAYRTPSTGAGWCAAWVSNVYENAGLGYVGGNACCMYLDHCHSSDRSQLKVGMIIAVQESPGSFGNWNSGHTGYGHVGIYIGDNQVMHNSGTVQVTALDEWIAIYGTRSQPRWGYPSNVAL